MMIDGISAYAALAAIALNVVFVMLVLLRTSRSMVFILFLFICASVIVWNFGQLMAGFTGRRQWLYVSLTASALIPALSFHFIITLVRPERRNTSWLLPAYGFSSLLALATVLSLANAKARQALEGPLWDALFFTFVVPFFLAGLVMLVRAGKSSRSGSERSRLRYLLVAGVIGLVTVVTDHVQSFGAPVPPMGHFGSVIYPSVLAVGVLRHREAVDVLAQMRGRLRMLNELSAAIAHEIRNPLAALKGAARLLEKEFDSTGELMSRQYLALIREEVERLEKILKNFQSYTRPLKLDVESVSVNELVEKTISLAALEVPGLKVHRELSEDAGTVRADGAHLKQVFINLLKNSFEACGQAGRLTVRTSMEPPWVRVVFSDDGPGFAPHLMEHAFEPFVTTKPSGTGMGLAISRRIVREHGGTIDARNLVPRGAEVVVSLPAEGRGP